MKKSGTKGAFEFFEERVCSTEDSLPLRVLET